jgi:cell wall-associated NlpC family hydrolase
LADLRDPLDANNEQHDQNSPTAAEAAAPGSRRERREAEAREADLNGSVAPDGSGSAGSVPSIPVAASAVKAERSVVAAVKSTTVVAAGKTPSGRFLGIPKPTKRGLGSTVVMTLAAGLIATMALPAYAFGNGTAGFDADNASGSTTTQSLSVSEAAAALAVSRDSYVAPTPEEFAASQAAAAAAVAATQAAAVAATAATTTAAAGPSSSGTFAVNPPSGSYSGQAVVEFAQQFVGVVPYGAGANPNDSFGCDGLTQYVFGQFGIYLPRIVGNQAAMGIRIAPEDAQAGDLVVWPMYHIGIYDGAGGVIDSPDWGRYVEHRALWGSHYFVRIVS